MSWFLVNNLTGMSAPVVLVSFIDVTAGLVWNSWFSVSRHLGVCSSHLTSSSLSIDSNLRIVGVLILAGLVHKSKALSFSAGVISFQILHIAVVPPGASTTSFLQGVVVERVGQSSCPGALRAPPKGSAAFLTPLPVFRGYRSKINLFVSDQGWVSLKAQS